MKLANVQHDHKVCLKMASELLGAPVRAVSLNWQVEQLLRAHLRLEARLGLDFGHPFLAFTSGPKGQVLENGLEQYRLEIDGVTIGLVKVVAPFPNTCVAKWYQFWAVPVEHYRRLYRFLRRLERNSIDVIAPIMRAGDRQRLWNETIGFLAHGRQTLKMYGVPQKRGVLLLGTPGNGKTMACRWLLSLCQRRGLRWRSVTAQEYACAKAGGEVHELFELDGPGIILFDDLDQSLRDNAGCDADRSTFLTELDGLHPHEGVVYLFTSNARVGDLDPAFRRPGRIDLYLHFQRPDAELRREFVVERWHADITAAIDLDRVVRETDGLSFAEIDEIKKLMVLRFLDTASWDWGAAWAAYQAGHNTGKSAQRIGFNSSVARNRTIPDTLVASSGA